MEPKGHRRRTGYLPFISQRGNGASDLADRQREGAKASVGSRSALSKPLTTPPTLGGFASTGPAQRRRVLFAVGALTGLIVAWTLADFLFYSLRFVVTVPAWFRGDEELAAAVVRFFGALVLVLFPDDDEVGRRLHWVAGGFFILGLGYLAFGYVEPLVLGIVANFNEELYEEIFVRSAAGILFIVALAPERPPRFRGRLAVIVVLLGAAFVALLKLPVKLPLPPLIEAAHLERAGELGAAAPGWLTPWHWALSAVPLLLALVAAAAAVLRYHGGDLRGWLLIALVVWAGSLMNEYLYPSGYYNQVLTTTGVLHTAFGAVVTVGAVFELRRIAAERTALLAVERENIRRLDELAALRADFGDMIAHELDSPLSAIRRLAEMLGVENLDHRTRAATLAAMGGEIDTLDILIKDVRAAAAVERDDFEVTTRRVPLGELLNNAEAYASALPGDRRLMVVLDDSLRGGERVVADAERIGQVLRNLLDNAVKYSSEGMPIELRASRGRGRVLIEVIDSGPGIHPEDLTLIFEKFGRARDRTGRKVAGAGLGLYLSRRIVQSHGSALTVKSKLGEGSVFWFELEVVG
jgi:signal transduction histidine kinase